MGAFPETRVQALLRAFARRDAVDHGRSARAFHGSRGAPACAGGFRSSRLAAVARLMRRRGVLRSGAADARAVDGVYLRGGGEAHIWHTPIFYLHAVAALSIFTKG